MVAENHEIITPTENRLYPFINKIVVLWTYIYIYMNEQIMYTRPSKA